ncbi:MAG: DUF3843 family protein [Acidobacteria bacterium]|nr:DUF3843 family protein [Acidobacteriota bacterium]
MAIIPYKSYFPEKIDHRTVAALQAVVTQCSEKLAVLQTQFHFDTLRLSVSDRTRLAEILVDFTFDLHTESGIWSALEKYNTNLFDTPLPLIHPAGKDLPQGLCRERVHFLLWNFYPQFNPGDWYSPQHADLQIAAEGITDWLVKQLPMLPKISPLKKFLADHNDFGWEIKKKLVWLGMYSYLFRERFGQYFEDHYEGKHKIAMIDDFICQDTTLWSGLGAIDILAECLDVPDEQKSELRSWYQRHASFYKIVKTDDNFTEAVNLINDISYQIQEGAPGYPRSRTFKPGMTVFGSLTPWRNKWYWSGEQFIMEPPCTKEQIAQAVAQHRQNTQIVARFWTERKELAFERMKEDYQIKLKHYGNDFVVLPDGRTFEREEIKRFSADMKSLGVVGKTPRLSFPDHLLNCKTGIGLYFDPVEGTEIMENFNEIRSGLKKNGKNCTSEEEEMLRIWLDESAISPGFIYRALKEYGGEESIKYAVCWETEIPYWLDYLLRCRKGEYYRNRYPTISFVDSD